MVERLGGIVRDGTNRRDFLRSCLLGAVVVGLPGSSDGALDRAQPAKAPSSGKSKVIIARDPELRGSGSRIVPDRLMKLLDRAVQSFYDSDTPAEAWKKVAKPGEVVGLKVNCLAGRGASTSVQLVEAISERLQQSGVKEIVVWDRLDSDLESAGFKPGSRPSGVRVIGNDRAGYEPELSIYGSVGSLVSQTLTRTCDAIINLPVLKDHGIAGVTMALKNFFGAIHNPNKYHLDVGDPYVADVNMLAPIRQKLRLHICDATTAQYEGGPSYMPQWSWPYNGLLVARDPVALDYTGWQVIERKRSEQGMKPLEELKRKPKYIATAADARHRLGTDDPDQIELIEA